MNVLTGIKEWLTVPEAAKHLSAELGEDVSESDIYRLTLGGQLQLSLYLVGYEHTWPCLELTGNGIWPEVKEGMPALWNWILGEIKKDKTHIEISSIQDDQLMHEKAVNVALGSKYGVHAGDNLAIFMLDANEEFGDVQMIEGLVDLCMSSHLVQHEIKRRLFPALMSGSMQSNDGLEDSDYEDGGILFSVDGCLCVLTKDSADGTEIPETRFPVGSVPVVRTAVLKDFVSALKDNHSKAAINYQRQIHARLEPNTPQFRGGRITETDLLTLDEAAKYACKHAGTDEITPADFVRSAARGEITLRAIVHREAKLQKHDGGIYCNQGESTENTVPKGGIPNLPLSACSQLANAGRASWRTFDGFEQIDGEPMRFTVATLMDSEPDFETVLADCRVIGFDVHALADKYIDAPAAPSGTPEKTPPPVQVVTPALAAKPRMTETIVKAFPPPKGRTNESWKKSLSDPPKWMKEARTSSGAAGISALWNPAMFALCMVSQRHIGKDSADAIIRREFADWLSEWERLAEHL